MTENSVQINNNVNLTSSFEYGKLPKWIEINFFGKLLNIICSEYENIDSVEDKGKALYNAFEKIVSKKDKKSFNKIEKLKYIDPLTVISYFTTSVKASVKKERLEKFFNNFQSQNEQKEIQKLKKELKNIFLNSYIPRTTFWDNIKNYNDSMLTLWNFAIELNNVKNEFCFEKDNAFIEAFKNIIPDKDIGNKGIKGIKISNLSPILFLCKPNRFYPIDETIFAFIKVNYNELNTLIESYNNVSGYNSKCNYEEYSKFQQELRTKCESPYSLFEDAYNNSKYLSYFRDYFYSNDNKPVCREERQYALFLYNKLLNLVNKDKYEKEDIVLLEKIGLDANKKILQVYYEVSFMRDFYKKGRDELKNDLNFNKKLYCYVRDLFLKNNENSLFKLFDSIEYYSKLKVLVDGYNYTSDNKRYFTPSPFRNYGSITKKELDNIKYVPPFIIKLMQTMMNSKPDIGIVYSNGEKKYLKFVECKYESKEDPVHLLSIKCNNKEKDKREKPYILRQTHVQYLITDFICKELIGDDFIKAAKPLLLKFNRKGKRENKQSKGYGKYYFDFDIRNESIKLSELIPNCFKTKPSYKNGNL